jgi:hypothetical protein
MVSPDAARPIRSDRAAGGIFVWGLSAGGGDRAVCPGGAGAPRIYREAARDRAGDLQRLSDLNRSGALARRAHEEPHPSHLTVLHGEGTGEVRFICKTVKLRVENNATPLTQLFRYGQIIELPIAHGEGRYVAPKDIIERLKRNRQILLTYYGENPNGSMENIAAIMNETGTVFGMMPHPERNSEKLLGTGDGLKIFQALVTSCQLSV